MARYVLRGGQAGYDRLQVLARARRADSVELAGLAGLRPGMRCVDLGCGGGEMTFELARLTGPGGSVTGIDQDEVKLSLAREAAAERGITNVTFETGDVAGWDEPGAADFAYCRFLLEHLSEPAGVLRRMWRSVRPGGAIAAESIDYDGTFSYPANDGFAFHQWTFGQVMARNGGDAVLGRKLYQRFLEAGIPAPQLRMVQAANAAGESKTLALLTLEGTAEAITAAGLATPAEVSRAIEDLAAFTASERTVIGGPRIFQLWSRRG
jgi:ubiquinone/menaquinone biosynthesis C-methylase UbiE